MKPWTNFLPCALLLVICSPLLSSNEWLLVPPSQSWRISYVQSALFFKIFYSGRGRPYGDFQWQQFSGQFGWRGTDTLLRQPFQHHQRLLKKSFSRPPYGVLLQRLFVIIPLLISKYTSEFFATPFNYVGCSLFLLFLILELIIFVSFLKIKRKKKLNMFVINTRVCMYKLEKEVVV